METKTFKFLLGILLVIIFFSTYFNHSSGSWSGDADGYFLGSYYLNQGKISNINSTLVNHFKKLDYSSSELTFLIPNRYSLSFKDNFLFRYPPGISYYISFFKVIYEDMFGYNFIVCVLSIINILLFYLLLSLLFKETKDNIAICFLITFAFGLSSLYLKYSMAQPMREIPVMFLNSLILLFYIKFRKNPDKNSNYLIFSISLSAISLYIRYTNIFIFIIFLPLLKDLFIGFKIKKTILKKYLSYILLIIIIIFPLLLLNYQNTSNFFKPQSYDHLNSIKIKNMYENNSRYKNLEGSFFVYIRPFLKLKYFLFVFFGIFYLFKNKYLHILLYPIFTLILFSMWPNPYDRYILPIIPFLYMLLASGAVYILTVKKLNSNIKIIFIIFFMLLLLPNALILLKNNFLLKNNYYKSLNEVEYNSIKSLNDYEGILILGNSLSQMQGFIQFSNPKFKVILKPKKKEILEELKKINSKLYLLENHKTDYEFLQILGIKFKNYYLYKIN